MYAVTSFDQFIDIPIDIPTYKYWWRNIWTTPKAVHGLDNHMLIGVARFFHPFVQIPWVSLDDIVGIYCIPSAINGGFL